VILAVRLADLEILDSKCGFDRLSSFLCRFAQCRFAVCQTRFTQKISFRFRKPESSRSNTHSKYSKTPFPPSPSSAPSDPILKINIPGQHQGRCRPGLLQNVSRRERVLQKERGRVHPSLGRRHVFSARGGAQLQRSVDWPGRAFRRIGALGEAGKGCWRLRGRLNSRPLLPKVWRFLLCSQAAEVSPVRFFVLLGSARALTVGRHGGGRM